MADDWPEQPSEESSEKERVRDLELVATARDRAAFRRLFEYYGPRVKAYLRRLGVGDDVVEDLVQEVFIAVWRFAGLFDRRKATVGTWIFTIARNKRIDSMRRDQEPVKETEEALEFEPDPAPGSDEIAELGRMSDVLREAIETLPEEQKRLIEIFYFEDKTHSAIAEELGLPLGTVKSRLRLALAKLRARLGEDPA
ncbi:MAG: sigma-70 family RNA polymerase sigma factor [Geminicoccaceae bacterium]|nr:sigma-70 family RNA polymerase sigma factor [Geminicoccaceae bacterium]MCS7269057.1 sigma-70 family RNA polymerase sigma factor [Geminicoccaceae bacterium]MCX7629114.1 sigma-70 family RNA polymerase sigma factor [Geminicoccaceae bacterium]MDW8124874.1 sigma-70 family RNA polymerase sigma factor [Geminicoccaceae bacterium]MDW8342393.1 sigma-70 family RNA polymerase sigma factor [Geminicoccaceae bacterium]